MHGDLWILWSAIANMRAKYPGQEAYFLTGQMVAWHTKAKRSSGSGRAESHISVRRRRRRYEHRATAATSTPTIHSNMSRPSPTTRSACRDFISACVLAVRLRNAPETFARITCQNCSRRNSSNVSSRLSTHPTSFSILLHGEPPRKRVHNWKCTDFQCTRLYAWRFSQH